LKIKIIFNFHLFCFMAIDFAGETQPRLRGCTPCAIHLEAVRQSCRKQHTIPQVADLVLRFNDKGQLACEFEVRGRRFWQD
jgi:hypothetical protein